MRVWKARPAESLNLAKLLFQRESSLTLLVSLQRQNSVPNLTMREGVQMRKVFALLLSVVMVMSLLVVAGADTAVTLSIEPQEVAQGATEVLFDVYLDPNGTKEIGAFQFSVSGQGCTITDSYVTGIDDKGEPFVFNEETGEGSFAYFGGALNDGVYTFVAAGTAKTGTGNHFWNATAKAKIVTLKATIESGASECKLIVDQESDKRFSVGYDNGNGVQPLYAVNVDSRAANLSGALLGDVNGDGKVNIQDVISLLNHVNKSDVFADASHCDINQDGKINIQDVIRLLNHVNKSNPLK